MQRTFKPTDRGKQVLDKQDRRVGTVTGVSDRAATVRPEREAAGLEDVTWTDDEDCFLISVDSVDQVDPTTVRLNTSVDETDTSEPDERDADDRSGRLHSAPDP